MRPAVDPRARSVGVYHDDSPVPPRNTRRHSSTVEKDDLRKALCRTCGVDLTLIDGIDVGTAMKMISESRTRSFALQDRQTLLLLARPLSRDQNLWWRGSSGGQQANLQSPGGRLTKVRGVCGQKSLRAWRLLPPAIRTLGQGQGGSRDGA
jgi:hypothetical protein